MKTLKLLSEFMRVFEGINEVVWAQVRLSWFEQMSKCVAAGGGEGRLSAKS